MKSNSNSLFGKIKSILPVSRKSHEAAMHQSAAEQRWLLDQMQKTVRRNVALESKLAQAGVTTFDQE